MPSKLVFSLVALGACSAPTEEPPLLVTEVDCLNALQFTDQPHRGGSINCLSALVHFTDGRPYDRIVSIVPVEYPVVDRNAIGLDLPQRAGTQRLIVVHTARSGPWPMLRHSAISFERCRTPTHCAEVVEQRVRTNPDLVVWASLTDYTHAEHPGTTTLIFVLPPSR